MSTPSSPPPSGSSRIPVPRKKRYPLPTLKADIQKVVDARGSTYTTISALLVMWEADDTDAASDVSSMSALLTDQFGITPTICKLGRSDRTPAWTLAGEIHSLLQKNHTPTAAEAKSLFIIYYVGHATHNISNGLVFCSSGGKDLPWDAIHLELFAKDAKLQHVDSLAILDCCYAGSARAVSTRSMQILAAAGPTEQARSRTSGASFTARFGGAVRSLKAQGMHIITIAAIWAEVERQKPNPNTPTSQLSVLGGSYPISLPFKKGRVMSPTSRIPIAARSNIRDRHILVSLTLDGRHKDATKEFTDAIQKLPGRLKITLVDAYETDASALILARMSLEVWATFSHHVDFDFVGIIIGPSLVHGVDTLQPVNKTGENIPPGPHVPVPPGKPFR
ncbi:uncharacterized protein N7482_009227 [Penicillium canariense]|uniref:Uncharacterized protein n=1 Tax=Penicillium canariense TaxID=189055 RepID=A0A9W9HPZ6_9EURO|nr:uncharacterized protein N7482_009227 [Penicillium canariense]KAJ5152749.1 hypothetical protein N7482_009227 [Penicillium canariense]